MFIQHKQFNIYFGDRSDNLTTNYYLNLNEPDLLALKPFGHLKKTIGIDKLMFAEQVHGIQGLQVTSDFLAQNNSFAFKGDFLSTNMPQIGIGVMSADCLPIIILDANHSAASIVHAGWRGSVQQIVLHTIEHMQKIYNTRSCDITIIFGPAVKSCCYEVQKDFIQNIPTKYHDLVFVTCDNKLFFDNTQFNLEQLYDFGICQNHIIIDYNLCTMCINIYCSYRRDHNAARQMSVVSIVL